MRNFLIKVAAGLTVVAISAVGGCVVGASRERSRLLEVRPPALIKIAGQLEQIIVDADRVPQNAITDARTIVTIRNESRGSLSALGSLLNSDIDVLATQLQDSDRLDARYRAEELPNRREELANQKKLLEAEILQILQVLAKKWPAKQDQMNTEIRKIISELGYQPTS